MSNELQGITVAFAVASEGIEQVELTEPWKAVEEAGGTPKLISVESGTVQAFNHLDKADTFDVDATFVNADGSSYGALVLPGGVANPDALRMDRNAVGAEPAGNSGDSGTQPARSRSGARRSAGHVRLRRPASTSLLSGARPGRTYNVLTWRPRQSG